MVTWRDDIDDILPPTGIATEENILVFYSNKNTHGRKDATGAFIPEAREFRKLHDVPRKNYVGIACPGVRSSKRREKVLENIKDVGNLGRIDTIAFFCHGWPKGIQFGIGRNDIDEFCQHLVWHCTNEVKIILYACLAAENDVRDKEIGRLGPASDGGFADLLRDGMVRAGISRGRVDAHKTAGHTTWNPYVVRFLCSDAETPEYDGEGGAWIVEPRSELWPEWIKALRDKKGGLRYRFPFLNQSQIFQELVTRSN